MYRQVPPDISRFSVTGINYRKSDASTRGRFAINNEKYSEVIFSAHDYNIYSFFILSTCNRTEIYGFTEDIVKLQSLLCSSTDGTAEEFEENCYSKHGIKAIEHLFDVASGLDSQVLGDYEIVGQLKQAVNFSKKAGFVDSYLERMVNEVLQACRDIRANTSFSGGTVSVSFAAVQYAKNYFGNVNPSILLIGTGKIGKNTCQNIVSNLPGSRVVLMNRTAGKAASLAQKFSMQYETIENMQAAISRADLVLVATNALQPIILPEHFNIPTTRLIIDLSVPCNVAVETGSIPGISLVNVDQLGRVKDETLLRRSAEIPVVKSIITGHVNAYLDWYEMRKHVPVLRVVKDHLQKIQSGMTPGSYVDENTSGEKIQKVINGMAVKMRTQNIRGCHYLEAMNDFIAASN